MNRQQQPRQQRWSVHGTSRFGRVRRAAAAPAAISLRRFRRPARSGELHRGALHGHRRRGIPERTLPGESGRSPACSSSNRSRRRARSRCSPTADTRESSRCSVASRRCASAGSCARVTSCSSWSRSRSSARGGGWGKARATVDGETAVRSEDALRGVLTTRSLSASRDTRLAAVRSLASNSLGRVAPLPARTRRRDVRTRPRRSPVSEQRMVGQKVAKWNAGVPDRYQLEADAATSRAKRASCSPGAGGGGAGIPAPQRATNRRGRGARSGRRSHGCRGRRGR